jgi:hypothetical protein
MEIKADRADGKSAAELKKQDGNFDPTVVVW